MVVEDVCVADADHSLSTRGIGVSIGTVDESAAAVGEVLTGLVEERATRALGSSDANTVPGGCQYMVLQ